LGGCLKVCPSRLYYSTLPAYPGKWFAVNHNPKTDSEELRVNIIQYGQSEKRNGTGTHTIASIKANHIFNYSNEEVKANAALICKAVNSHKSLVDENKRLVDKLNDLEHYIGYIQDTVSRGAVPADWEDWVEIGKPLTK